MEKVGPPVHLMLHIRKILYLYNIWALSSISYKDETIGYYYLWSVVTSSECTKLWDHTVIIYSKRINLHSLFQSYLLQMADIEGLVGMKWAKENDVIERIEKTWTVGWRQVMKLGFYLGGGRNVGQNEYNWTFRPT